MTGNKHPHGCECEVNAKINASCLTTSSCRERKCEKEWDLLKTL